jgi:hypothetical protein
MKDERRRPDETKRAKKKESRRRGKERATLPVPQQQRESQSVMGTKETTTNK